MFKNLEREVFHNLYKHGANISIATIKESMPEFLTTQDCFDVIVKRMTTSNTNSKGRKFRLKEDKNLFSTYDPFFYIAEDQVPHHTNNIIGDYEGHYKYQTSIPKTCRQAMCKSEPTLRLLLNILKHSCKPESEFTKKLFPVKTLHMSLKLVIWMAQESTDLTLFKEQLPKSILKNHKNLREPMEYLSQLIHGQE